MTKNPPGGILFTVHDMCSHDDYTFQLRFFIIRGCFGEACRSIPTYPGTFECPCSRLMARNPPGGILFTEYGINLEQHIKDMNDPYIIIEYT